MTAQSIRLSTNKSSAKRRLRRLPPRVSPPHKWSTLSADSERVVDDDGGSELEIWRHVVAMDSRSPVVSIRVFTQAATVFRCGPRHSAARAADAAFFNEPYGHDLQLEWVLLRHGSTFHMGTPPEPGVRV